MCSSDILARCAFFIGNDSGLTHLAAAARIPTLGLFGPSPIEHYAPWGPLTAVVRTTISPEVLCPPGFDFPNAKTLMESLSVDAAEEAALALWRRVHQESA